MGKKRKCPRRGVMGVGNRTGFQVFETNCNTWRCFVCSSKLRKLVQEKMEYGILTLDRLKFITLTVSTTNVEISNTVPGGSASFVREKWALLLRKLAQRLEIKQSQIVWFRIVELTKKEMPHLHLLMRIPSFLTTCRVNERKSEAWLKEDCGSCVEHLVGGLWYELTGAFIFDVTDVYSKGIGGYMIKEYLAKTFQNFELMEWHGFKRRYTYSRAWPKLPRLRLLGTIMKSWDVVQYVPLKKFDKGLFKEYPKGGGLFERVGDTYAHAMDKQKDQKRTIRMVKSVNQI